MKEKPKHSNCTGHMPDRLQMGCLPSRSTAVSPAVDSQSGLARGEPKTERAEPVSSRDQTSNSVAHISRSRQAEQEEPDEEVMSIVMLDQDGQKDSNDLALTGSNNKSTNMQADANSGSWPAESGDGLEREHESERESGPKMSGNKFGAKPVQPGDDQNEQSMSGGTGDGNGQSSENSFDDELNLDLLKQYIAVDHEISQLENKNAMRIYHERIEQLEHLERELDMISSEAEEVAARSEVAASEQFQKNDAADNRADVESESMLSGATNSVSPKSSFRKQPAQQQQQSELNQAQRANDNSRLAAGRTANRSNTQRQQQGDSNFIENADQMSSAYSTIEGVFNRKILLEKERDRLKKEVELVIIECDKLQQKYKKRDEILDKLFDGRTGNGLENHLEQQLNWLIEQKHYVDQVFYAWKRAETLTSQTCEQFASALELLKRLPKLDDEQERGELSKSIAQLLIKSRQDMEQAQRYNPNVDAPFFTDTETERFHKIIETISQPKPMSQSEYNQTATVIQFAYKRAVSIRLWLEQILQITIARDSFELAEEYKWIAIQLRKERITLINSKLQEAPYRDLVQTIREEMAQQQLQLQQQTIHPNSTESSGKKEINRDSGVESDDVDIEEEIYRILEMNKSRLEVAIAMQQTNNGTTINQSAAGATPNSQQNSKQIRERIQRRMQAQNQVPDRGQTPAKLSERNPPRSTQPGSVGTPSKLRIELDEASRQNLLKQVDQIHSKHRSKLESLRGSNKAKANDFITNRMQQAGNRKTS